MQRRVCLEALSLLDRVIARQQFVDTEMTTERVMIFCQSWAKWFLCFPCWRHNVLECSQEYGSLRSTLTLTCAFTALQR
jgi:hypothetical protein